MIIDSHSHWLPEEIIQNAHFFHKGWGDIEAQVEMMRRQGIARAVLTYPTSDAQLKLGSQQAVAKVYNDNVAKILKRYPDEFIGAAVLPVENSRQMLEELKRSTGELGFKAICLATSYDGRYLDDAAFLPIYREAKAKGLPIFVHSQIVNPIGYERVQDPLLTPVIEYVFDTTISIGKLLMAGILEEFAEAKFIFAHFGGVLPFLSSRFDATYQMLRGMNFVKDLKANPTELLKRIYVDTSGDKVRVNLEAALALFGPGHILWGSDWPAKKDISGAIEVVRSLNISEQDKENILGGNLAGIIQQER